MLVQVTKDGAKNFSVQIKGFATKDFERVCIVDLDKITAPSSGWKGIRLDSVTWAIQEKMGLDLWWEDNDKEDSIVLVMESRNSMRFEDGVHSPRVEKGWGKKLYLSSFKCDEPKGFFLILDFDKQ